MSKFLIFLLIILIFGGAFIALNFILPPNIQLISLINKNESSIVLYFVGDIMLDRGVEYMVEKEGGGDFRFPFLNMADYLKKADILSGNLESPISDKGVKVGSIYSFRAEKEAVEGLKYAGFDILSLANNHMLDYQRAALEDTMEVLQENKIDYVGAGFNQAEAFSLKIKEIKNTRIGFLAYTDLGPETWKATKDNSGMAWFSENELKDILKDISSAKEQVDVLAVALHSGEEYQSSPTLSQRTFARLAIEAGADLVIGHHPHVVQEVEQYMDGWIAYSLGNFVFDQPFSEETMEGLLLEVKIEDGEIKEVNQNILKLSDYYQPYLSN
ncbi:MAG: CapA family protein [Candidatus Nealsonbacteria bacterium]|nr:CapA family protein [Candidatus Nealsonbacteria bacterium]